MRTIFGSFNLLGLYTLTLREQKRFTVVWTQTILAPIVSASLFLTVFAFVLSSNKVNIGEHNYTLFVAPGILTMMVIQHSFANTSSSILISKVQGNIVDTLVTPLRPMEIVLGYMLGGISRGLLVSFSIIIVIFPFIGLYPKNPFILTLFLILASANMSLLGIAAGIMSQKFDHMQALTNFVITPLTFLSGTFYSIKSLPPLMADLTLFNPIFLLIDGVRYGCIGYSEGSIIFALAASLILCGALIFLCTFWVSVGYKLKN